MLVLAVWASISVACGLAVSALFAARPRVDPGSPAGATKAVAEEVRTSALGRLARRRLDPAVATGLGLTAAALVVIVGVGVVGALWVLVRTHHGGLPGDGRAAHWGAVHATSFSTSVLRAFTWLGSSTVLIPLAVVVAIVEARRQGPAAAVVAFVAVVLVGEMVLSGAIKGIVDRARPDIDRLASFGGPSFPSGHSSASAAAYAAFALVIGRGRSERVRRALSGGAVAIAVAVAESRVLLGVHWLTDVVAGLALGWTWFAIVAVAFGGRLLRFGAPVEVAERVEASG